jgi:hypothetical protein
LEQGVSFLPKGATHAKLPYTDDVIRPDCIERFVGLAQSNPDIQVVLSDDVYGDVVRRPHLRIATSMTAKRHKISEIIILD